MRSAIFQGRPCTDCRVLAHGLAGFCDSFSHGESATLVWDGNNVLHGDVWRPAKRAASASACCRVTTIRKRRALTQICSRRVRTARRRPTQVCKGGGGMAAPPLYERFAMSGDTHCTGTRGGMSTPSCQRHQVWEKRESLPGIQKRWGSAWINDVRSMRGYATGR